VCRGGNINVRDIEMEILLMALASAVVRCIIAATLMFGIQAGKTDRTRVSVLLMFDGDVFRWCSPMSIVDVMSVDQTANARLAYSWRMSRRCSVRVPMNVGARIRQRR
jgi:hypothetical protein